MKLNEIRIESLRLSTRAINCLRSMGIRTVADACKYRQIDYLRTKNLGRKTLAEIEQELFEKLGARLAEHRCEPVMIIADDKNRKNSGVWRIPAGTTLYGLVIDDPRGGEVRGVCFSCELLDARSVPR